MATKKVYKPQELEQMGDAIDLLKDEPEFREIFLKKFPHLRQSVEEEIKEREEIEKTLNKIQNNP